MIRRLVFQIAALFLIAVQAAGAAPIEVYILTGQSNSLGTTSLESVYAVGNLPEDAKIPFFWSNVSGASTFPPTPVGDSSGIISHLQMQQGDGSNPNYWGPEYGFGRTLYEAGRTNILIIKASNTGTGNTAWDKSTFVTNAAAGFMWYQVTNTVLAALGVVAARSQAFSVRGLLYIQGEGNTAAEAPIAGTRFTTFYSNLMASINAAYPGTADGMRAVLGEIGASQANSLSRQTTTQQMAAAASNISIAFVGTRDQPIKSDGLHFPRSAKLEIGRRLANCFLGRPTIVSIGFDAVTNTPDATSVIFEQYVPDTNGVNEGVNLETANSFAGFATGAQGQPQAGLLVSGSSGNVVFADYYTNNISSDIACGQYNFTNHGLPANWADSGTSASFTFAVPTNTASSALVSAAAFEVVAPVTNDLVSVSLFDGRGDTLYTSGTITNGRFGFVAQEAFSKVVTLAVSRVTLQGATNVLWTIGHVTDGGVPDFAWNGWRIPSSYERWSFLIADPVQRGNTADPDGDGAPNLLEYAMGTNPTNKLSVARLGALWTNGGFAMSFSRTNADDITWHVQRTFDLGTPSWSDIATKQGSQAWSGAATVNETTNSSGAQVLVYDPAAAPSQHYLRLRVSTP